MKPEIPFNPFKDSEPNTKDPRDMSLEELELLLYSKRLELRLDLEKFQKKINYSKIVIDVLNALGVPEKLEKLYKSYTEPPPPKNPSPQSEEEN